MIRHCLSGALLGAVFLISGCEKETPSEPAAHPAPPAESPATVRLPAADPAQDAPTTPTWLPAPEELGGWVRTSPTQAITVEDLPQDDAVRQCASGYGLKSLLRCQYTAVLPRVDVARADVLLVETEQPQDAYGLFTVVAPTETRDQRVGSLSCYQENGDHRIAHGWQGPYYVRVSSRSPEPPQVSVEKLAAGLARPIPSVDPPALLKILPAGARHPGREWVIRRHLQVLPETIQRDVLRGSARETTMALGLDAQTTMVVQAYDPGDGERPNYVWLVEYPSHQDMIQAVGRYKSLQRTMKPSTEVLLDFGRDVSNQPAGRYLCGTWTPDQESIMHVLPRLAARLPLE